MKISVIVPAYNSENFISETLDCLLSQTLKDIQIVVINDGSADGTGRIIDEYASNHPNILPVHQTNAGVSTARNNGIELAEGKYILFLDSDDLLSENALELMYNALEETGSDLAICRVESFGIGGRQYNPVVDALTKEKNIDCYDKRLLWNFLVSNKCYRAELLKNKGIRFPSMRYSEDGAFFMQFIHTAKPKITGVYDAVFRYRRHPLSVTQKVNIGLLTDFSKSMDYVYRCAENSFEDFPEKKDDYLQETICKTYFALINEFYRLLWVAEDDEALAYIGERCDYLTAKMNDETKRKCHIVTKDISPLVCKKSEICEKPFISVIAKNTTDDFISSLYSQMMPSFELITTENGNLPDKENVVILSPKSFKRAAKKAAKGKITAKFNGNEKIDSRMFKYISLLRKSRKFRIFPDFMIIFGAKILLKLKK